MKSLLNISLAVVLATISIVAAAPDALARTKHRAHAPAACVSDGEVGGIIVLGLLLGAVTGGVGSAVAYGSAYAIGGAAIGGAGGAVLGAAHGHHHCE